MFKKSKRLGLILGFAVLFTASYTLIFQVEVQPQDRLQPFLAHHQSSTVLGSDATIGGALGLSPLINLDHQDSKVVFNEVK